MSDKEQPYGELRISFEGKELVVFVPHTGVILDVQYTFRAAPGEPQQVRPYRLHCKGKGIHL